MNIRLNVGETARISLETKGGTLEGNYEWESLPPGSVINLDPQESEGTRVAEVTANGVGTATFRARGMIAPASGGPAVSDYIDITVQVVKGPHTRGAVEYSEPARQFDGTHESGHAGPDEPTGGEDGAEAGSGDGAESGTD